MEFSALFHVFLRPFLLCSSSSLPGVLMMQDGKAARAPAPFAPTLSQSGVRQGPRCPVRSQAEPCSPPLSVSLCVPRKHGHLPSAERSSTERCRPERSRLTSAPSLGSRSCSLRGSVQPQVSQLQLPSPPVPVCSLRSSLPVWSAAPPLVLFSLSSV